MTKKLSINQKTVSELFSDKHSDFIIPDYQRPYSWEELECSILWDDIYNFAIPGNDYSAFDESDEYFLGPIVVFKNKDGRFEVIDGQQRLTTLMLLLRAFYEAFGDSMLDANSQDTKREIAKCVWKTDTFGRPLTPFQLKIDSEVAMDNDKKEFTQILQNKPGTRIYELVEMAKTQQDFSGDDIARRTNEMLDAFMNVVAENNLLR